jgi:asparagine synthetase B (glutamine-hydrolysing)
MCGFFLLASTSPMALLQGRSQLDDICRTIGPRGPDARSVYEQQGVMAVHTHLRITGYQTQPLLYSGGIAVYNGEIYNEYEQIAANVKYSDANTLLNLLETEGIDGLGVIEGEFALCLYDPRDNTVAIATDTFGTKPVYFAARQGLVAVGSYNDTLIAYDPSLQVIRVPSNTLLVIDVSSGQVKRSSSLWQFDFSHQTNESYEAWVEAFLSSIRKRTAGNGQRYYVPLSSGYDSGLIASSMLGSGVDYQCYSVPYLEDDEIIARRVEILREQGVATRLLDISPEEYRQMHGYLRDNLGYYALIAEDFPDENFPDPDFRNIPGYVAAAIICRMARSDGRLIQLSGQGSDEILTDYSTGSMRMSELKGNWSQLNKPWKNLHQGWNAVFLGGTERISGLFGIETRYPFLDRSVAQAFINLKPELKEARFKGPVARYFDEIGFPYVERKQGFAGFDVKRLD